MFFEIYLAIGLGWLLWGLISSGPFMNYITNEAPIWLMITSLVFVVLLWPVDFIYALSRAFGKTGNDPKRIEAEVESLKSKFGGRK